MIFSSYGDSHKKNFTKDRAGERRYEKPLLRLGIRPDYRTGGIDFSLRRMVVHAGNKEFRTSCWKQDCGDDALPKSFEGSIHSRGPF